MKRRFWGKSAVESTVDDLRREREMFRDPGIQGLRDREIEREK